MATRRGHGEGSISQRKDGRWTARIDLGYVNGKRKQIYGKTRKEVAEQLKVLLHDQKSGATIATERQTVAQFLDYWLEDVIKVTRRHLTYKGYEAAIRLHLKPSIGRYALTKLNAQHINAMVKAKLAEGLSPRTVARIRAILHSALKQAVKMFLVPRNVVDAVTSPRFDEREAAVMTQEEAQRFLKSIKGEKLEAFFTLVLATGLRMGEVLALHWQDVDLDAALLRVRWTLRCVGGQDILSPPKTDSSKRTITIPAPVIPLLRDLKVRQLEERLRAGSAWRDEGFVFTQQNGRPLGRKYVRCRFGEALQRAGLQDMRIHDLRHSCATLYLAQNVHAKVVQGILGHSKISTTMDIYSHVLPSATNDAALLMGRLLAVNE